AFSLSFNKICLKRESASLSMDDCTHGVITHRQDCSVNLPCVGDCCRHFTQRLSLTQLLRTEQVRRQVSVAEAEPGFRVIALQRLQAAERFLPESPAFGLVDCSGECIGNGIEVGGDV